MKITLNKILATICILLVLIILLVTVLALGSKKARPGSDLRRPEPIPSTTEQILQAKKLQEETEQGAKPTGQTVETKDYGAYTTLGQIRASTMKDPSSQTSALVIVEPWFSYSNEDPAFEEELDNKRQKIRSIFLQLFANSSFQQLRDMGEAQVKTMLLESINKELILGKIDGIFFEEYLFLE